MLSNPIEEYTNYIYGYAQLATDSEIKFSYSDRQCGLLLVFYRDVPTKMDNDVMTALHGVEIDGDTYPKVRQWHAAMQNHSLEDRNK